MYRFTYISSRETFSTFSAQLNVSCKNGFILLAVCLIRFYLFLKDDPNSVSEILPDFQTELIRLRGQRIWDKQLNMTRIVMTIYAPQSSLLIIF